MAQPHAPHPPAAWSPFVSRREWHALRAGLDAELRTDVLRLVRRMEPQLRARFLGHLLDQLRRGDGRPVAQAIERAVRAELLV